MRRKFHSSFDIRHWDFAWIRSPCRWCFPSGWPCWLSLLWVDERAGFIRPSRPGGKANKNPKPEAPKSEGSRKSGGIVPLSAKNAAFRASDFGLASDFGFRASDFGLKPLERGPVCPQVSARFSDPMPDHHARAPSKVIGGSTARHSGLFKFD